LIRVSDSISESSPKLRNVAICTVLSARLESTGRRLMLEGEQHRESSNVSLAPLAQANPQNA
jgi:hypothetical protein